MRLVRLIYASKATPSMEIGDVTKILDSARKKNKELGITGVLCYDDTYFTQWLEGPRHAVNEIYSTILRDWRHDRITLLEYAEIDQRSFADWSMGYVSSTHLDSALVLKYSSSSTFAPFMMSATSIRSFLIEFGKLLHEDVAAAE